jgi:hypothetical protein
LTITSTFGQRPAPEADEADRVQTLLKILLYASGLRGEMSARIDDIHPHRTLPRLNVIVGL